MLREAFQVCRLLADTLTIALLQQHCLCFLGDSEGNPFASPEIWARLVADPVTRNYLQQDDYRMMLDQLRSNPSAIARSVISQS